MVGAPVTAQGIGFFENACWGHSRHAGNDEPGYSSEWPGSRHLWTGQPVTWFFYREAGA